MTEDSIVDLETQHTFLEAAKTGNFQLVLEMLKNQPRLVNVQPAGRWSALHQAAGRGASGVCRSLLRYRADANLKNRDGNLPWQVAYLEPLQAFLRDAAEAGPAVAIVLFGAASEWQPTTYDIRFAYASCMSALIGNRYDYKVLTEDTGPDALEGLDLELIKKREKVQPSDFEELLDTERRALVAADPRMGAVQAYTADTWVYADVNKALREKDESKVGLAPFIRLLHDTLANPQPPFKHWRNKCWRWVTFTQEELGQYRYDEKYMLQNFITFAGFTSACKDKARTWENKETFGLRESDPRTQVLVIIEVSEDGDAPAPVDVSFCSQFPEEAEVLFPTGQQFAILEPVRVWNASELIAELGAPAGAVVPEGVPVLHVIAVDKFYDLCDDFFRGGGTAEEALQVLDARLAFERRRCPGGVGEALALRVHAGGLVHVGRLQESLAQLYLAMDIAVSVLGHQHQEVGKMHRSIAETLQTQGNFAEAAASQERALEILGEVLGAQHPEVATTFDALGVLLQKQAQFDKALDSLSKALDIRMAVLGEKHPDTAASYTNLGNLWLELCRFDKAHDSLSRARDILIAMHGEQHPDVAAARNSLGRLAQTLWRLDEACSELQQAHDIYTTVFGESNYQVAKCHGYRGCLFRQQGLLDKALESYRRALDIHMTVLGERHLNVATAHEDVAEVLGELWHFDEAFAHQREALETRRLVHGEQHPDVAKSLLNIGTLLMLQDKSDEATEYFQKSLQIFTTAYGERHPYVIDTNILIGNLLREQDQIEEALETHRRALNMAIVVYGEQHPTVGHLHDVIGADLFCTYHFKEGLQCFTTAYEVVAAALGEQHPDVAVLYVDLAYAAQSVGRTLEADGQMKRALETLLGAFGPHHPRVAEVYTKVGLALGTQPDRFDEAIQYSLQGYKLTANIFGEHHPRVAATLMSIGQLFLQHGESEKAEEYMFKALAVSESILPENHSQLNLARTVARWSNWMGHGFLKEVSGQHQLATKLHSKLASLPFFEQFRRQLLTAEADWMESPEKVISYMMSELGEDGVREMRALVASAMQEVEVHEAALAQATDEISSKEQFAPQLAHLAVMGFDNQDECLRALVACKGNVDSAIDALLLLPAA